MTPEKVNPARLARLCGVRAGGLQDSRQTILPDQNRTGLATAQGNACTCPQGVIGRCPVCRAWMALGAAAALLLRGRLA